MISLLSYCRYLRKFSRLEVSMKVRQLIMLGGVCVSLLGAYSPSFSFSSDRIVYAKTGTSFSSETIESKASAYVDDSAAISIFIQVANSSNKYIGSDILSANAIKKVIYFDNNAYRALYVNERKDFLKYALTQIKQSKLNAKSKNKLYNFLSLQDGDASKILRNLEKDLTADIATGKEWYEPFNGPITTILGLVALGVFIGLGLSMVMDIAYLVLPPVRRSVDTKPDGRLPILISAQALNRGTYMAVYLKRRAWAVALVMIALGYLNSGLIFDVVGNFIQVFSDAFRD